MSYGMNQGAFAQNFHNIAAKERINWVPLLRDFSGLPAPL